MVRELPEPILEAPPEAAIQVHQARDRMPGPRAGRAAPEVQAHRLFDVARDRPGGLREATAPDLPMAIGRQDPRHIAHPGDASELAPEVPVLRDLAVVEPNDV